MATLKQRLHRKNSSGSYDTIHLETSSSLVLRPSGRTVEQDLEAYLPKVQDSDTVPESLHFGRCSCHNIFLLNPLNLVQNGGVMYYGYS